VSDTGYLRKVGAYAYFSLETAIYIRLKINIYEAIIFHVLSNGMKVWLCLSLSLSLSLSEERRWRDGMSDKSAEENICV
jgi:hypothetical protein